MSVYTQLSDIQKALNAGEITMSALVQNYLEQIERHKNLNAFIEVFADEALQKARILDAKTGPKGRLFGAVIGIKDVLNYKGHKATSASRILTNYTALYNATAIERLLAEDAIIIGRTNCDEFAMGASNENSAYGPVLNGADPGRVPGGSSGGSAVAVQMNMCWAALGTDTGGSIRQPAAFCGVVGMKPTYGRISRYGLIPYASSFDQIGPITHTVEDNALLLEIMAGADDFDSTASLRPVDKYTPVELVEKTPVAVFNMAFEHPKIDPELKFIYQGVLSKMQQSGFDLENTAFDYQDYLVPVYYILTTAEASSNLGRFDGIRYGYHSENATDLESTYIKNRSEGFGPEVKRRIMLGTFVLSAGYYDAYYTHAQKVRRLLQNNIEEILSKYPFIILPTTPTAAFKLGDKTDDPIEMYLADMFTVLAPITGHPAISIPVGKTSSNLPVGIQIISRNFDEKKMLQLANHIMQLKAE